MTLPTFPGSAAGVRLLVLGIFAPVIACLLSGLICRLTPRASAAARHLVWLLAFVAMAVCLPITLLNLRVALPILPASPAPHPSPTLPVAHSAAPAQSGETHRDLATSVRLTRPTEGAGSIRPAPPSTPSRHRQIRWEPLVLVLWALGFVFQSFIFFAGILRLQGIIRRSRFCEDSRLVALCNELGPLARCPVGGLLLSSEVKVPLVASLQRLFVILPEAARQWPSPMLRTAFIHELAHLERNDLWWSAFARWVASVYWFHPLAWQGLRRLQAEAEMAADDRVVIAGLPPVDYAENLLHLVRTHRQSEVLLFPAIGMVRTRGLEARVARILDPSPRRLAPHKWLRLAALSGAVLLTIGSLLIRLVAAPPPPQAGSTAATEINGPRAGADSASPAPSVTIALSYVGDAGNPPDTNGRSGDHAKRPGAVTYPYAIGTYDITLSQYAAFLNAVARTDPYGLYDSRLETDANIYGITQSGTPGDFTYAVIGNSGDEPVTYSTWMDAARFCNWLQNGQPATGVEDASTTEAGAYTLNGDTTSGWQTKNPGAKWWIPTDNEWYKAAYYDPKLNGGSGGYWTYATQSNTPPGNVVGDGPNQANHITQHGNLSVKQPASVPEYARHYLTPVGSFTHSASYYGTYDQNGEVYQWIDGIVFISANCRWVRGGAWGTDSDAMKSSYSFYIDPTFKDNVIGFRVASLPESITAHAVASASPGTTIKAGPTAAPRVTAHSIQVNPALYNACESGDLAKVRDVLDHDADPSSRGPGGYSVLQIAVQEDHLAVARLLIERGADVNYKNQSNDGNVTALHMAVGPAGTLDLQMVSLLLDHGADVKATDGIMGYTPLSMAATFSNAEIFNLLLNKGADLDAKADGGVTPLMIAAGSINVEVAKRIIELRPNSVHERSLNGDTPLSIAQAMKAEYAKATTGTSAIEAESARVMAKRTEEMVQLLTKAASAPPKAASAGPAITAPAEAAKPSAGAGPAGAPGQFAGIWTGTIFRSGSGNTDNITLVVNAKETSATVSNFFPGPQTGSTTITGNSISWKWMLASWKMTVNQDGQTAKIDCDSPFEACRGTLVKRFDH